ncbi:hypothetical protein ACP3VS_22725 [Lysinibacillus sp. VIII_CA]|uniref:hypothetical protein n=1 Tax=Lysinibacillus sp. VIII_CA TaxID=3417452 RepID=UPI003CF6516B
MPNQDQNVMDALNEKFYQVMSGKNLPSNTYLSIIDGGYLLSEKELAFLEDYQHNMDEAYRFSALVNRLPATVSNWIPTGSSLAHVYRREFLELATFPSITLDPEQEKVLAEAKKFISVHRNDYRKYELAVEKAQSDINELNNLEPRPADYTSRLYDLTNALNNANDDWKDLGYKNEFEKYRRLRDTFESAGLSGWKDHLKELYDNLYNTNKNSQGSPFVPTMCIPHSFYKPDFQWNHFTFTSSETEKYESSSSKSWSAGARGSYKLFWGSANASGVENRTYLEFDTNGMEVNFDYIRIHLDRPWFEPYLLEGRAWWWPTATKENPTAGGSTYSNGAPPPDTQGTWQMTPQDIIFVKNLVIKLDYSKEINRTSMKELKAGASAGFAFWKLGGANYNENSNETYNFKENEDGVIIANQMQISSFLCTLMPKEPNPDTSLMPHNFLKPEFLF